MNSVIKNIKAREILDSRGNPTVEVEVISDAAFARASAPSGASTGTHEALELRDGGKRYNGEGVLKAVKNVNNPLASRIIGTDAKNQAAIDHEMIALDGTPNKSKFGANALLPISMAVCKAGALEKGLPLYRHIASLAGVKEFILPVPSFNIINGGKHADNELSFQEFMILPIGARSFSEALRMGAEVYHILKKDIHKKYGKGTTNVGDEGGFAPEQFNKVKEPLRMITKAISELGYDKRIKLGMDAAASEFFRRGAYYVDGRKLTSHQLMKKYIRLIDEYPIASIEDPFDQEDFESFSLLTKEVGERVQIVGDDLLVTNVARIEKASQEGACDALLLKVNQIGTVSEALEAGILAQRKGWGVMVSHRSGETEDSFIADLAVGLKAGQIKSGAPCRGERLAKYNQLLRIEEELGKKAKYAGNNFRKP